MRYKINLCAGRNQTTPNDNIEKQEDETITKAAPSQERWRNTGFATRRHSNRPSALGEGLGAGLQGSFYLK